MIHRGNSRALLPLLLVFAAAAASSLIPAATAEQHQITSTATISQQQEQQHQQQNEGASTDTDKIQELREDDPDDYYYLERLLSGNIAPSKRASMRGFQGMRGKKSSISDYDYSYPIGSPNELYYYLDKKAPMGFQGMRGKKISNLGLGSGYMDAAEDESMMDKRAPYSAFQGVRGKKSLEEALMEDLEKRARMAGFQGMRGKKAQEYEESLSDGVSATMPEWQKRAPSRGFQGMRGRKSMLEQLYDDELVKRALNSFHGMRGKKDTPYAESDNLNAYADGYYVEKRPMMMSFHGMRGKRNANYYDQEQMDTLSNSISSSRYEKRSPYRFFGSRGKKNPRWESRARGFVGVRGKRLEAPRQLPWPVSVYDEIELAEAAAEDLGSSSRIDGMAERH